MTSAPAWRDPIVAELHAIRDWLAERFQYELTAYSEETTSHSRALGFFAVASHTDTESTIATGHGEFGEGR